MATLKPSVGFTLALLHIHWQAGQRIQHKILLASVRTKGLDDAAKLAPAFQGKQQVQLEQIEGLNHQSRTNLIRFKTRFQVKAILKTIIRVNICKMTTSLPATLAGVVDAA